MGSTEGEGQGEATRHLPLSSPPHDEHGRRKGGVQQQLLSPATLGTALIRLPSTHTLVAASHRPASVRGQRPRAQQGRGLAAANPAASSSPFNGRRWLLA